MFLLKKKYLTNKCGYFKYAFFPHYQAVVSKNDGLRN
jgi:hypothetical protein